jgi:hypothetical protein
LVDRGPYAGAHRLDVSQKALIAGLDGLLFDRQSRHVIGDATRAKRLVSTPERSCIGSPERICINDSGKKAPELGAFS